MYLLDTNVWITFLRKSGSPVVPRLQAKVPADIRVCSVVAAELYHGCLCSAKPTVERAKVDALIAPYVCLPFDEAAADQFADIRRHIWKRSARRSDHTTCKSPPSLW